MPPACGACSARRRAGGRAVNVNRAARRRGGSKSTTCTPWPTAARRSRQWKRLIALWAHCHGRRHGRVSVERLAWRAHIAAAIQPEQQPAPAGTFH